MLIDDLLPVYDVREQHRVQVRASPSAVYAAISTTDLGDDRLVRALLFARALPGAMRHGIEGVRAVMDEASREAYRTAIDLGISMVPIFGKTQDDVPDNDQYALDLLDAVLASYSLPDTRVAVLQDWDKGRRGELDAFSGYIVAQQEKLGTRAPVNEAILRIAERVESGELEPRPENASLLIEALGTVPTSMS